MIKQSVNLNMIPNSAPVVIHANQYDVGAGRIEAKLYNGDVAYTPANGATVVIQGMKPDGHGFMYDATISGNTVTADLTEQMTAAYGMVRCQIVVTEGGNVTGTFAFNINVQESALPVGSDVSASEYDVIMQLMQEAEDIGHNVPYIGANGNWWIYSSQAGEYIDSGVDASISVQIADITMLAPDATPYVTNSGTDTDPIFHLGIPRGKGISSIQKTSTAGLVDTYTITYSDGYTTTFDVTNGATGNGIVSIVKTGTSGLVDTYTITYTNGSTDTFTVTNGRDGTGSGDMTKAVYDPNNHIADAGGIEAALNGKVDKVAGKGLSTNDYDNTAKTKLDDLANIKSVGTGLSLNGSTGELTATGGGGGGTWGSITGTLSDQTDLQNALDAKVSETEFEDTIYGKNLLHTIEQGTLTSEGGINQDSSSVLRSKEYISVEVGETYVFSGLSHISGASLQYKEYYYAVDDYATTCVLYGNEWKNVDTPITVPSTPSGIKFVRLIFQLTGQSTIIPSYVYYCQFEEGSTPTAYQPYDDAVLHKIDGVYSSIGQNGAKNYLKIKATTTTKNGVTFTIGSDGTITITVGSGGITGYASLDLNTDIVLEPGAYIVSDGLKRTASTRYGIRIGDSADSFVASTNYGVGNEDGFSADTKNTAKVFVQSDAVITSPIVLKPMIRLASDPDETFHPYAMTNRELTEFVTPVDITSQIAWDTSVNNHVGSVTKEGNKLIVQLQVYFKNDINQNVWQDFATLPYQAKANTGMFGLLRTGVPVMVAPDGYKLKVTCPTSNIPSSSYVMINLTYFIQ